jgi:hypothetical protein
MTERKLGGATEAAGVLGVSISQFNSMRLLDTYIYDPVHGMTKVDPGRADLRPYLADKHLMAPTFAGRRHAGGRWEYNLVRLREYRCDGWCDTPHSVSGVEGS